jgi:ribonuclease VapC
VIVDSSAVVAILLREPGWEPLLERVVVADPPPGIGVPTLAETGIVLAARLGIPGKTLLARFVQESGMRQIAVTAEHWTVAVDAYLRFGKGRHPAALNFGDCLTYAISRIADESLLRIGDDFTKTDLHLVDV